MFPPRKNRAISESYSMKQAHLIKTTVTLLWIALLLAFACSWRETGSGDESKMDKDRLVKSDKEWSGVLPRDRFDVLFKEKTEPSFSSELNKEKRRGTYICAACLQPLFSSAAKYESGSGWPSFTDHLAGSIETKRDFKLIYPRTEYHCSRCGGHQGHLFNDGPLPTGKRYCNNGLALIFVPEGESIPELRQ